MIKVSVIIPTRDASGPIRNCLAALLPGFPADAETIVVSDGGATDPETRLSDFREPLRLRCIRVPHGGPAWARNNGLAIAQGEIAAFTDDDCRPRPGWIQALRESVCTSPAGAVGGVTFNGVPANPCADAAQVVLDLVAQHERNTSGDVRFFPANNCAYPVEALRRLGGFDVTYQTAEDRDLLRRWRAAGFSVTLAHDAIVDHEADPDLGWYVRKFYGYGRGAARFHATDTHASSRDSKSFHLSLPYLVIPELRARGVRRGATLIGLLALWEVANLVGFVAEAVGRTPRPPSPERAAQ